MAVSATVKTAGAVQRSTNIAGWMKTFQHMHAEK